MNKVFSDFVEPISPTHPAGIDVEYDARFINIQTMVEGKPEQQYGDVIIEAEEPDWGAIEKLCCQILSETKDLRVFCFYTQALTANYGLKGFDKGCQILQQNIELYWADIYPTMIDEDGDYDPFYRINALQLLTSSNGIVKQLNSSRLMNASSNQVNISVSTAVSILTGKDEGVYPGGKDRLLQDLKVGYESNQEELLLVQSSLKTLNKIEAVFNEKIEDNVIDFTLLKKPLNTILSFITLNAQLDVVESDDDSVEADNSNSGFTVQAAHITESTVTLEHLKINNREDVSKVLDKLIIYFRVKEPSHPAPLFIERLQRLMNMNFYDILKDISPSSLDDLDKIIGQGIDNADNANNEDSD